MLQDSDSDIVEVDLLDPSATDIVGKLSFSCFIEVCIACVVLIDFNCRICTILWLVSVSCRIQKKQKKILQGVFYLLWYVRHFHVYLVIFICRVLLQLDFSIPFFFSI